MKVLTVVVPCYNSESYLDKCIGSLLSGGSDIEIIIVNDGSSDKTPEIADGYAKHYPDAIRVIHKENGGHGSGINAGLKAATGVYFKVLDSDDRLSEQGLFEVMAYLKNTVDSGVALDMLLTNYVYDKKGAKYKFVMKPEGLPKEISLSWDRIKRIKKYHYIPMHSIIYRTELLRDCGMVLPEHTYYVDNIFAFQPLPLVKTFCYKDIDLYWYYIGREDQSVSEENVVRQIDQYIRVVRVMAQIYRDSKDIATARTCLEYMLNYLEIVFTITCAFLSVRETDDDINKKKELWSSIEETDPDTALRLRRRATLIMTNLPGKAGCAVSKRLYRLCSRVMGLN